MLLFFRENREELTFVLIGALGSGKSSTGNSILGGKPFKVMTGTMPVTKTVEKQSADRKDRKITVVDTPGLENVHSFTSIKHGIDDILLRNKPTNIIYLITIKIGRYTKEERDILDHIFKTQGSRMKNAIIIFTNRSELMGDDTANQSVDAWIKNNRTILRLKNDNKLKYYAFENKRSTEEDKDVQVKELIDIVDQVDKKDDSICDVSEHMNMENKRYVDEQTLGKKFGDWVCIFRGTKSITKEKHVKQHNICGFFLS